MGNGNVAVVERIFAAFARRDNADVSRWAQRNRGKGSGVELEMESAIVWTFENGRIVRVAVFPSHAEAREAAGLPLG